MSGISRTGPGAPHFLARVSYIDQNRRIVSVSLVERQSGVARTGPLSGQRPALELNQLVDVTPGRTRGTFTFCGLRESSPEPITPSSMAFAPMTLLVEGKNLWRKGLALDNWFAVQKEAETWIAFAKAEIERYNAQSGPDGSSWKDLLVRRDAFCKVAETIINFQRVLGLPVEEIEIPPKPVRPLSCDRLEYLRGTCAKIFEIGHNPERKIRIEAWLAGEDIRPWLEYLNSGGGARLAFEYREYQDGLNGSRNPDYYPNLIRDALSILNRLFP